MNKTTHRILVAIGTSLTGISGLLGATDTTALGVSDAEWGWVTLVIAAATLVVNQVRVAFEEGA